MSPEPDVRPPPHRDSAEWIEALRGTGPEHDAAVSRLHALLVRAALAETHRRRDRFGFAGRELEDLAQQVANDTAVAVLRKLDEFRGESRFTTWVYRFVVLEVTSRLGRHLWRRGDVPLDSQDWEVLPDRLGLDPAAVVETVELAEHIRTAVEQDLTEHQRRIFRSLVLARTPVDVLALERDSNRNAIYKTMFDARRTLRLALTRNGFTVGATTGGGGRG